MQHPKHPQPASDQASPASTHRQFQNNSKKQKEPRGKPEEPLPNAPHPKIPINAYSIKWIALSGKERACSGNSLGERLEK